MGCIGVPQQNREAAGAGVGGRGVAEMRSGAAESSKQGTEDVVSVFLELIWQR